MLDLSHYSESELLDLIRAINAERMRRLRVCDKCGGQTKPWHAHVCDSAGGSNIPLEVLGRVS